MFGNALQKNCLSIQEPIFHILVSVSFIMNVLLLAETCAAASVPVCFYSQCFSDPICATPRFDNMVCSRSLYLMPFGSAAATKKEVPAKWYCK